MSDTTAQSGKPKERAWYEPDAKLSRRHAADRRLRIYGIAAILFALVNPLNKLLLFLAAGLRGGLADAAFATGSFSVAQVTDPTNAVFLDGSTTNTKVLDCGSASEFQAASGATFGFRATMSRNESSTVSNS